VSEPPDSTRLRLVIAALAIVALASTTTAACSPSADRTASNSTGTQPTVSAPAAPVQTCPLSADFIRTTVAPVFSDGPVRIEPNGDWRCFYHLASGEELDIRTMPYSENEIDSIGVDGANRKYGGSAPDQVYASARTAYRDVAAADPQKSGFGDYPNVGAGLVTDNMGNFILAGTKSYWYAGGFSNTNVNPAHNDPVVAIAKALAAR
jgi:hypothetical protein